MKNLIRRYFKINHSIRLQNSSLNLLLLLKSVDKTG